MLSRFFPHHDFSKRDPSLLSPKQREMLQFPGTLLVWSRFNRCFFCTPLLNCFYSFNGNDLFVSYLDTHGLGPSQPNVSCEFPEGVHPLLPIFPGLSRIPLFVSRQFFILLPPTLCQFRPMFSFPLSNGVFWLDGFVLIAFFSFPLVRFSSGIFFSLFVSMFFDARSVREDNKLSREGRLPNEKRGPVFRDRWEWIKKRKSDRQEIKKTVDVMCCLFGFPSFLVKRCARSSVLRFPFLTYFRDRVCFFFKVRRRSAFLKWVQVFLPAFLFLLVKRLLPCLSRTKPYG